MACSEIDTDSEENEANNSDDFDGADPKFDLSIERDREEIDESDEDPEDADEDTDAQFGIPVLDDEASCGQFE